MKKIILLSLMLFTLFLLWGCAPAGEPAPVEDLSAEDLAALPTDLRSPAESRALAGQAIYGNCLDPDASNTFDRTQVTTRSTTTFEGGSRTDRCYTWYAGTPQEKTRLIEGVCRKGKFQHWYADCSSGTRCQDGACVAPLPTIERPPSELCVDTDGGAVYDVKGYIVLPDFDISEFKDRCQTGPGPYSHGEYGDLLEYVCHPYGWTSSDGTSSCSTPEGCADIIPYTCPYGCSDGVCLPATSGT